MKRSGGITLTDRVRVSVVIPAYNEEAIIGDILSRVHQVEAVDEVIVVDDGSTDGTANLVVTFPKVRLVRHPYNIGNGAAIKSGLRAVTGDVAVLMDADGQHPPEEIPTLLARIADYDMVVGARNTASDAQLYRTLANRLFNLYASYIVGYYVPDLTSGFRALRTPIARKFLYLLPNGYSYPTTLTICLFRAGYAVRYEPFRSPARMGKSKVRPLRDGIRFLLTLTRLAVFFVPLKIFLPLSIAFILTGGGYTIGRLVLVSRFSGFGGLVTMIGVIIFMIGLVSEQIALLRYMNTEND
jgi:glycosyltransferase involved in cell wall biosynthesis